MTSTPPAGLRAKVRSRFFPDPTAPAWVRTVFRFLAFAEAVSWAALLTTMFFKWVVQEDPHTGLEGGVPISGPIHGGLFMAYCAAALVAWLAYGWRARTLVLALVSAVPPFMTVWFERRVDHRGELGAPARTTGSTTDTGQPAAP